MKRSMRARAFWTVGNRRGEIRDETIREPESGEVSIEALWSGVSRGTEALVFAGLVPESERERMRCPHQAGEFPFPVKYGYASVGRVVRGPERLQEKLVFCLHPHQSAYVVGEGEVVPLPPGVPPERAVLGANLETALNGVWDGEPRPGDRVTVVGAGVVGLGVAALIARYPGIELEVVDPLSGREAMARGFGASFARPERASADRDLIFHASGSEAGLRLALELAAPDATLVELSWFGSREPRLPLGGAFHARRLTLRSSQVGTVSPRARARMTHRARLELALGLLADPRFDALITSESSLEELPRVMPELTAEGSAALCHRVRYG